MDTVWQCKFHGHAIHSIKQMGIKRFYFCYHILNIQTQRVIPLFAERFEFQVNSKRYNFIRIWFSFWLFRRIGQFGVEMGRIGFFWMDITRFYRAFTCMRCFRSLHTIFSSIAVKEFLLATLKCIISLMIRRNGNIQDRRKVKEKLHGISSACFFVKFLN